MLPKYTNNNATNLSTPGSQQPPSTQSNNEGIEYLEEEDEDDQQSFLERHTSIRFLLAGGIAGAGMFPVRITNYPKVKVLPVSRTCTAPFDRLKVFLITRSPDLGGVPVTGKTSLGGVKVIGNAIARIYTEGGILAFWTGNGLSVAKIFPESAIKFFAYESAASF